LLNASKRDFLTHRFEIPMSINNTLVRDDINVKPPGDNSANNGKKAHEHDTSREEQLALQ
jgi:hypothetical protein